MLGVEEEETTAGTVANRQSLRVPVVAENLRGHPTSTPIADASAPHIDEDMREEPSRKPPNLTTPQS
jgi:hypothetical protein